MFLYARLVMDNLSDQPNKRLFFEECQKKFPEGLSEAWVQRPEPSKSCLIVRRYERILQRIRRDSSTRYGSKIWEMIRMLLGWLVCARRLLKWQEIQLACCIDLDHEINFEEDRLRHHIRDYCGSLIEASPDEFVRFVHGTTSR